MCLGAQWGLPGHMTEAEELVQHRLHKGGLRKLNCIFLHLTKGYRHRTCRYRATEQGARAKSCRKVNSG